MANPWLGIPLADYEGHMSSAEVQQLDALAELFSDALNTCQPSSVAVLGVAGGNGLERINPNTTTRVVGIDINPEYLDETRQRFRFTPGLDLRCADLAAEPVRCEPVQLVHAALLFEHAGTDLCLKNAIGLVAEGGALSVVLQLPSELTPGVGASPFQSLQRLKPGFSLIDPAWFEDAMSSKGFARIHQSQRALPGGKSFWLGIFRRRG